MSDLILTSVLAPNPGPMTLEGTNTYIVGDGSASIVIDPGVPDSAHLEAVAAAGARLGGVQAIVVTHAHPDHMGGARELAEFLVIPVLAVSRATNGVPFAARELAEGEVILFGSQALQVLLTPGHRFDHCCLWHAPTGQLFAGDLMAGRGTVVIAPPDGDMRAYLASLHRLRALPLTRIWPGHGPAIDDPLARIEGYIAHRLEREGLVMTALREAGIPRTVTELVPVVYQDTPAMMYPWAARSLLAHLLKLEAEGHVARVGSEDAAPWQLSM